MYNKYLFLKTFLFLYSIDKLSESADEIKRLEDALQQSRDSLEDRERQLKREIEQKVNAYSLGHTLL